MEYSKEEIEKLKKELHSMEYEKPNFYSMESNLEEDIISLIKGENKSEEELIKIEDKLEAYLYNNGLNSRRRPSFLSDGFEVYVTNLEIKNDVLEFIVNDLNHFNSISISSEIDGPFSALNIKVYCNIYEI